ncbi:helix-turn-helix transcriptional regulator [Solibacillus sp. FSL W7-1464]|uniref:helix-turn-helix domain-containing protein n=1 Tax=Solibacillus sp. FSL W7-1464 TaxID=2921706 RepID=UPI0030F75F9A
MNIGTTLQKIRKSRQITQANLARNIMTQGAYSKIEKSQLSINLDQFLPLITKININLQEFCYILNGYELSERERIIKTFTSLEIASIDDLQKMLKAVKEYLVHHPEDQYIDFLQLVYKAFIILQQENTVEKSRQLVAPIWHQLQILDDWYINDFELLNAILFLFPLEVAMEMTKTAERRLEKYDDFPYDVSYLGAYFRINLSFHYIERYLFEDCLTLLEETELKFLHKMRPKFVAILFERKAICLFYLQRPYEVELERMEQLLTIYKDEETKELLLKEFHLLTRNL